MPYKNCQHVLEDGHRCNRTFGVATNRSSRKYCPEHEPTDIVGKNVGIRKAQAKQEAARKFLNDLHTYKIDEIDRRLNRLRERQTSFERKLDRVVDNMQKLDENFTTMKELNSKITESLYDKGPDFHDRIQKQILTLSNRIKELSNEYNEGRSE